MLALDVDCLDFSLKHDKALNQEWYIGCADSYLINNEYSYNSENISECREWGQVI